MAEAQAEYEGACGVRQAWSDLVDDAGAVDAKLYAIKLSFSETTRVQVAEFLASTVNMNERFREDGPGQPGIHPSQGLELLRQFQARLGCRISGKWLWSFTVAFGMDVYNFFICTPLDVNIREEPAQSAHFKQCREGTIID